MKFAALIILLLLGPALASQNLMPSVRLRDWDY
jgi:hypothetical protein